MTTPPEGFLFDVAAPPTPVERLLLLADQYVQHNDMLDRLLRAHPPSEPNAHAASAQRLASATRTALKAVTDVRLFRSPDLSDAVVRLEQLAFLSSASADQQLPMARTLTALAPEAAMGCANTLAYEIRRRGGTAAGDGPEHTLTAAHHTALWEIACGNVVVTSSLSTTATSACSWAHCGRWRQRGSRSAFRSPRLPPMWAARSRTESASLPPAPPRWPQPSAARPLAGRPRPHPPLRRRPPAAVN